MFGKDSPAKEDKFDMKAQESACSCTIDVFCGNEMFLEQIYLPRLSTSKLKDGTLTSPPIEDLDPIISASILEKLLGQKLHPNSLKVREK